MIAARQSPAKGVAWVHRRIEATSMWQKCSAPVSFCDTSDIQYLTIDADGAGKGSLRWHDRCASLGGL